MSEVDYAENYMEQDDYSDNESSEGNDLKVSIRSIRSDSAIGMALEHSQNERVNKLALKS